MRAVTPLPQRFWPKVKKQDDGCWIWTGALLQSGGYGQITLGSGKTKVTRRAHVIAYELMVGPVPEGLELDHLCRVRRCVNPAHLEPVTRKINNGRGYSPTAANERKTHCLKGHPFDEANTYVPPSRPYARYCRACQKERDRKNDERTRFDPATVERQRLANVRYRARKRAEQVERG